jgi:hypothetical protein
MRQKSCGPRLGNLVYQLIEIVTFAYDPHFRCMIARWKGLSEEYTFFLWKSIKYCLGPQNGSENQGPEN